MKTKKAKSPLLIISLLSLVIIIVSIFTFIPMQFGTTTYTGVWGAIGISSDVYGGMYAEYDITGDASKADITNSMGIIKKTLQEQGYESSSVYSIDGDKIRVEIGYPKSVTNSFSSAYSDLTSVASGALEFRSSSSSDYKAVTAKDHIKEVKVVDYQGSTYLSIVLNDAGTEQYKSICTASSSTTIYVYMGKNMQTSFSVPSSTTDYSQIQLSVSSYDSAKDFYYKAMYGSLSITLNSDTVVINTMTSTYSLGTKEGVSVLFYILIALIIAALVAGFIFLAIKYRIVAVLMLPLMLLNAIIACWIFAGVSIIEINITSLIAIILGISLVFTGAISYMERINNEYKQGKTIDASIEAGTKKARPAQIISSIIVVAMFAVFTLLIKGEVASASLILVIFGFLNALTNIVLLPLFVNLYNKTNKNQGKPFGLKQEENINE